MQEGYVHLAQHGKLTLDSKKLKGEIEDFLKKENRFNVLTRKNPEASARLHHHLQVGVTANAEVDCMKTLVCRVTQPNAYSVADAPCSSPCERDIVAARPGSPQHNASHCCCASVCRMM
jgi:hypothetical protein